MHNNRTISMRVQSVLIFLAGMYVSTISQASSYNVGEVSSRGRALRNNGKPRKERQVRSNKFYGSIKFLCLAATPTVFFSQIALAATTAETTSQITNTNITSKQNLQKKPILVGEVNRGVGYQNHDVPSQKKVFKSGYAIKEIGRDELKAAGPQGGAAQALAVAPGVNVSGYGSTGATKYQISINGVTTGWQDYSGANGNNGSIMVTFDGIPMNNLSTGLWQSPEVSNLSILNGIQLTYGPGPVANRFYDNIGGSINFQPIEPTKITQGKVTEIVGSNNYTGTNFSVDTGEYKGWAAVLAGGFASGNSYIVGSDGFAHPFHNYAYYGKIIKKFHGGRFSIGGLDSEGVGFRPDPIPVNPVPGLTLTSNDAPAGAELYSQKTTGFYTTVPEQYNNKIDKNLAYMIYAKLHLRLEKSLHLANDIWYRYGTRQHFKTVTPFSSAYELENPFEYNYGDRLVFTNRMITHNTVKVGGYFINSTYQTNEAPNSLFPKHHYRANFFNQQDLAVFIQDNFHPSSKLNIIPGVRIVNYQTQYNFATPGIYPEAYLARPNEARGLIHHSSQDSFTKLEGSFSANWRPVNWLAIFGSWGNSYRQPPTGGGGGPYQGIAPGNFTLEAATEYQAGLKVHFKHFGLLNHFIAGLNWYFLHWTDKYVPYSITVDGQSETISAFGATNYQGVNLFANGNISSNLHAFINASFEQAHYLDYTTGGLTYKGLPASYVPTILFNGGLSFKKYISGVVYRARGWFSYTGPQNIFNNNTGLPSLKKMPAYGTLNASLGAQVPLNGIAYIRAIGVHLSLLNILNSHYNVLEEISSGGTYNTNASNYLLGSPGAPFTVYGSLSVRF